MIKYLNQGDTKGSRKLYVTSTLSLLLLRTYFAILKFSVIQLRYQSFPENALQNGDLMIW